VAGVSIVGVGAPVSAVPATVLVDETFSNATVGDALIAGLGFACLTGATDNARVKACPLSQSGPVPVRGTTPGYLQLTDVSKSKAGSVLYDRPIPASAGIDATFEMYQYGGSGADGIAFYLVDGATDLTAAGGTGGSLGYAQHYGEPGINGGYLGIGFDVYGNFYDDGESRGQGCPVGQRSPTTNSGSIAPNTVVVRGPGSGGFGYCYLASTTVVGSPAAKPISSLPGRLDATSLAGAKRTVHVVITPSPDPVITVQIDFDDGNGFQTVIDNLAAPAGTPSTYKFGFSGSTGDSTDVHLVRNVVVGTVEPLARLNLVKQVSRETPLAPVLGAGSSIPYEYVVTNAGEVALHDLAVDDPEVGVITCPAGDIPPVPAPGSTVLCTGSHVVSDADVVAGQAVNVATATALDPGDVPVASNPDTVTVPLNSSLDVSVGVTTAGPYRVGGLVEYSYAVTNTGGAPVSSLGVHDALVPTITCPSNEIAPGQTVVCNGSYTVRLQDISPDGTLTHFATASGVTPIGQLVQSGPGTRSIPVAADIRLTKSVDNASPTIGQNVTYTITASNLGPSAARSVVVGDPLPNGTTSLSVSPSAGTFDPATRVWSIPALAVNQSAMLVETARVDSGSTIVNGARVTGSEQPDLNSSNDSASVTANPLAPATDIAVVKTLDRRLARVGETITATLTVNNAGPQAATGVTVRDPLPAGVELMSATGTGTYDPTTGVWSVGALAVSGTASIDIAVRATTVGFVLNTASLATVSPNDINPANDIATAPVVIDRPSADLSVGVSVRPADSAPLGEPVAFVVSATNNGPDAAPSVVVDSLLSSGLTFASASPEQGTFNPADGRWSVGALAAGTTVRLELFTTAAASGRQTDLVSITDPAITDRDGSNNAASAGLQIDPPPVPPVDIGIALEISPPGDLVRGEQLTFVVTVSNSGPNTATGVKFSGQIPPGFQPVAITMTQGTFDPATGTWDVGTLGVGDEATLSGSVIVDASPGDYTNIISLIAVDQLDTNDQNNTASSSGHVVAAADLEVTKTVSPPTATLGDTVTYTVTVTNNGPETDTGVQVMETNRTPGEFSSLVLSKGEFDPVNRVWTIGDLAAGESATITAEVLIITSAPEFVTNHTVVFAADLPDPNLINNEAVATLLIPHADLAVSATPDDPTPTIGEPATITVDLTNNGPTTALNATVTASLPADLNLVSSSATVGTYDPDAGIWSVGDLNPGDHATLALVATPSTPGELVTTFTADDTGPPDFVTSNNHATATLTVETPNEPPPTSVPRPDMPALTPPRHHEPPNTHHSPLATTGANLIAPLALALGAIALGSTVLFARRRLASR
jgi:uncharacterized repeat protein (TIGR01451 family)